MAAINNSKASIELLEQTRAIMEVERSLSEKLERIEPWISTKDTQFNPHRPRVRPIPRSMEEAMHILSVARTLSNRTSAPAGWNPGAPVVNFSTPNPLPHQLRGGALAALQLERAKQAEREKKRQKIEEQQQTKLDEEEKEEEKAAGKEEVEGDSKRPPSAKRVPRPQQPSARAQPPPKHEVSMNLSDSSSDDEDEDD